MSFLKKYSRTLHFYKWLSLISLLAVVVVITDRYLISHSFQNMYWSLAFANMVGAAVVFFVLLDLLKLLFNIPWSPLAVAKVMMDEVIRLKVPLMFMVFILMVLSVMPFMGDSNVLLYRVQAFISSSLTLTYFFIGIVSIFLAAGTMNHELEHKLYYTTLVKPVSRATFLFGKWIGLICLNAVLLTVTVVSVYTATYLYVLPQNEALNRNDEVAVRAVVLTSRESAVPLAPEGDPRLALDRLKREDPRLYEALGGEDAIDLLEDWSRVGGEIELRARLAVAKIRVEQPEYYFDMGEAKLLRTKRMEVDEFFRKLPPGAFMRYDFHNLQDARQEGKFLQFKFKVELDDPNANPHTMHMLQVPLVFGVEGTSLNSSMVVQPGTSNDFPLDSRMIDDEGKISLLIFNGSPQHRLIFPIEDGIRLYYPQSNMYTNILRSIIIMWVQLSFMALLALCLGSLLTMPVVTMICISVFLMAIASDFLAEEVEDMERIQYRMAGFEYYWREFLIQSNRLILKPISQIDDQNPIENLAEGLFISWRTVFSALFWKGVVWGAVVFIAGWFLFRRRELARVQV